MSNIIKPLSGIMLNPLHPLSKGLVGLWLMNEGAGSRVADLSGKGNHGTIVGADWVPDGLDLEVADITTITDSRSLIQTDENFTIIVRYTPTLLGAASRYITGSGNDGTGLSDWCMASYNNLLYVGIGGSWRTNINILTLNEQNNVAIRYNGSYIHIYDNGVQVDEALYGAGHTYGDDGMYIGGTNFDGIVAHVFIYNRALSPSEVARLNRDPYCMLMKRRPVSGLYVVGGGGGTFTIDDADSDTTIENVVLELESGNLAVADIDSLTTIENIVLEFEGGELVIADIDSASQIDNIVLQFEGTFLIDDIDSGSSIENISLMGAFIIGDIESLSEIENIVLVLESGLFVIADIDSLSEIENIVLVLSGGTFTIANIDSATEIDNITLEDAETNLFIDDIDSLSTIENILLELESGLFIIGDIDSVSDIDNIVLEFEGGELVIADIDSATTIDNITLLFEGTFIIGDIDCGSEIDNVSLMGDFIIEDIDSTTTIENIVLELESGLFAIEDIDSLSSIENIVLVLASGTFVIADLSSATTIENIVIYQDTGLSYNRQLLIDSIGGKVIELGNSTINTWNTAGRPTGKLGIIGFNTETSELEIYNGSSWISIT